MYYFVVNPASKTGLGIKIWHDLKKILDEKAVDYRFYMTDPDRNATVITRLVLEKYQESSLKLIVLGGDGTVNEALQAFHEEDFKRVILGYIPTGSSNDLARALGYQAMFKSPTDILEHILNSGASRNMDLGLLEYNNTEVPGYTKRFFSVSCGMGFDASVCEEALNSKGKTFLNKLHLGKLSYGAICVKQLFGIHRSGCTVTADGQESVRLENCYFVSVLNHCYQGGGIKFCPDAVDDDGMLDICYASDISKGRVLTILPQAFSGNHVGKKGIGIMKVKSVRIVFDDPMWVHTDGEVKTKSSDVTVTVLPGRLKFMV